MGSGLNMTNRMSYVSPRQLAFLVVLCTAASVELAHAGSPSLSWSLSSSSVSPYHGGGSSSSVSSSSVSSGGSSSTGTTSTGTSTLPRSQSIPRNHNNQHFNDYYNNNLPPWNPSSHIDDEGFLQGLYHRTPGEWEQEVRLKTRHTLDLPCRIRQVPGDGNCLFHSISLCLGHAVNGTHWDLSPSSVPPRDAGDKPHVLLPGSGKHPQQQPQQRPRGYRPTLDDLYSHSQDLRSRAVACLRERRRRLVLQGRESLPASALVEAAAQQYDMSGEDYCCSMQQDSVWGGGPEIVALSNLLQRPIHVYELAPPPPPTIDGVSADNKKHSLQKQRSRSAERGGSAAFVLRRMACFGSPRFDRNPALHILSADSRFPDIRPGQQLPAGNHFLAVFPVEPNSEDDGDNEEDSDDEGGFLFNRQRRKRLRGGDSTSTGDATTGLVSNADSDLQRETQPNRSILERTSSKLFEWWSETFNWL